MARVLPRDCLTEPGTISASDLIEPSAANPKGFFEDRWVNAVNERILRQQFPYSWLPTWPARLLHRGPYYRRQLWLAVLDRPVDWKLDPRTRQYMAELASHEPYAFKDPRFSYTLNAWRPYLRRCRFVCVFRNPRVTAASIAHQVAKARYYGNLAIGPAQALAVWTAMYSTAG